MNEDNPIKVPYDMSPELLLVNGDMFTKGEIHVALIKTENQDGDIELKFQGTAVMPYYVNELSTIETNRYYVGNIDVYREQYTNNNENIIYDFTCEFFRAKYQSLECVPYDAMKIETKSLDDLN